MANAWAKFAITSCFLGIAACSSTTHTQPTAARQPECSLITYPENERIGAWSVDKFTGRYSDGTHMLTVRRDQRRLIVEGWVLGTRQLTAASVESWTWRDGCGVNYAFILPPDGPGAWLTVRMPDGRTSDWHR